MDTPKTQVSTRTILLFAGGIVLGGIIWFLIFAQAWGTSSTRETVRLASLLGGGGAFMTAAVTSAIQPHRSIFWSTGFALPMFGWGLLCAVLVPLNSVGLLWWTFFGFMMAAASLLGAWLGRLFRRS